MHLDGVRRLVRFISSLIEVSHVHLVEKINVSQIDECDSARCDYRFGLYFWALSWRRRSEDGRSGRGAVYRQGARRLIEIECRLRDAGRKRSTEKARRTSLFD